MVPRKNVNKQLSFIITKRKHLKTIKKRRCSRFTFAKNPNGNSPKVVMLKSLGSHGPLGFVTISQFYNFKNPFAKINIP